MTSQQEQQYLHAIRVAGNAVMHYDPVNRALAVWYWPVDGDGQRVSPSELSAYRRTHAVDGPYCLCPFNDQSQAASNAIIDRPLRGRHIGQYVASCSQGRCRYLVLIECIYTMPGVPVKRYRLRRGGTSTLPPSSSSHFQGLIPFCLVGAVHPPSVTGAGPIVLESHDPRPRRAQSTVSLLLQLDSYRSPGLTLRELEDLLVSCRGCGIIMTRRAATSFHECTGIVNEDGAEAEVNSDSD
ncbi:hypothetical protein BV25DRAFT_1835022 [Artomyces pyxidatus]|uniref:Uncharacterized protein n=1 Tax=Artomyces pyxidatus TaxID=48021 RepID=A0ACB8TFT9_9AGAM|nr:hypothetical protein BV25DRAFT_1835022 [Artomyces pyxidatus]